MRIDSGNKTDTIPDEKVFLKEGVSILPTFGRKQIFTSVPRITSENVQDVVAKALHLFSSNQAEIKHLYNVYRGEQAILGKTKEVRPEINNRCVVNHANEIVSFKVSYLLSEPIMYVARGNTPAEKINALNDYMHLEGKSAKDKQIADDFNICGVAYRMPLPNTLYKRGSRDESPFKLYTLDPEQTFVVRSTELGNPVVCGVYTVKTTDEFGIEHLTACVYTDTMYYEIDHDAAPGMAGSIRKAVPHALGRVPIFEYINNESRLGAFEVVETQLEAINTLTSNRLDAVEQTVQSLTIFKNCEIDSESYSAIREMGAMQIKSGNGVNADVELLSNDLNQTDQQVFMDDLYNKILAITGMPARASDNSDSSNNGAVFMRGGWYSADARAKDSELLWKQAETDFLRLVLKICRDMGAVDLSVADIDMKFTRRNYEDILSKSQSLVNMLSAGVDPLSALTQCGLFGDPNEVFKRSAPYLKKWVFEEVSPDEEGDSDAEMV